MHPKLKPISQLNLLSDEWSNRTRLSLMADLSPPEKKPSSTVLLRL